jgi:hypothetical protein
MQGVGGWRLRFDVAVPNPRELDCTLEAEAGTLVLDEPAALHPDLADLVAWFAQQAYSVSGRLEYAHTLNQNLLAALVDLDAVHLLVDVRQRKVGAMDRQIADSEIPAVERVDHVGVRKLQVLVGHESQDSHPWPRASDREVPQAA